MLPEGITIEEEQEKALEITVTPASANTPEITITSGNNSYFTVEKTGDRTCKITGVGEGTANLTAKAGNVQAQVSVTVTPLE